MSQHERYENPLTSRYASAEMSRLWSEQRKHSTWRKLWVVLAEAEVPKALAQAFRDGQCLPHHVDDDVGVRQAAITHAVIQRIEFDYVDAGNH